MSYASVPTESKSQIKRAGDILAGRVPAPSKASDHIKQLVSAFDLANRWRACHAYPINTFNVTLRKRIARLPGDAIAAQRLKRIPTIIDKLRRYPAMNLTTMQDIAGVRAIVERVEDVYRIAEEYKGSKRFAHELVDERDYIGSPRDQDGYRSLHLMFKYTSKVAPDYNGLRIEMQLRTKLQHTWATAVETMGTFLGQALKSRQGNERWLDFFALVYNAFAHRENAERVPRYSQLSYEEAVQKVINAEAALGAINTMRGISVAAETIEPTRASYYHLIVLDSINRTVQVTPYEREKFDQAVKDYAAREKDAVDGAKIEPVLVSAGPLAKLRKAYPSFFLDIEEFLHLVSEMVGSRDPRARTWH